MEPSYNGDQNFFSRGEEYRPYSPDGQNSNYRTYEARPPPVPLKTPLEGGNANAAALNGNIDLSGGRQSPDDFYRDFRASSPTRNAPQEHNIGTAYNTAARDANSRPIPASLRSNGNGMTPKHPPLNPGRTNAVPSYRTVSTPLESRMAALNTAKSTSATNAPARQRQPSGSKVSDMLKRFDQNGQANAVPRNPTSREPSRGPYERTPITSDVDEPNPFPRAGSSIRDGLDGRAKSPATSRATQRNRFATEDQYSNNTLSSATRNVRTRNDYASSTRPAQSNNAATLPPPKNVPAAITTTRKALFGEVLPHTVGSSSLGYGIHEVQPHGISDPVLLSLASSLARAPYKSGQSPADIPPASPSAWYRGENDDNNGKPNEHIIPPSPTKHNRSQSESSPSECNTAAQAISSEKRRPSEPSGNLYVSRLPVMSRTTHSNNRRLSTSSDSTSAHSTRASSPFAHRAANLSQNQLKSEQRPFSPAGRSMTPTHRSPGRRTPSDISPNSRRLPAQIKPLPPAKTPDLRRTDYQRSVADATTASSRSRAAANAVLPQSASYANRRHNGERKPVTANKIDYNLARDRVKEGTRQRLHQNAQLQQTVDLHRVKSGESTHGHPSERLGSANVEIAGDHMMNTLSVTTTSENDSASIGTSNEAAGYTAESEIGLDSPTLGIPGTFPTTPGELSSSIFANEDGLDNPSIVSRFTNFENNPPLSLDNQDIHSNASRNTNSHERDLEHDNGPIRIVLDTSVVDVPRKYPEDVATAGVRDSFEALQFIPEHTTSTGTQHTSTADKNTQLHGDLSVESTQFYTVDKHEGNSVKVPQDSDTSHGAEFYAGVISNRDAFSDQALYSKSTGKAPDANNTVLPILPSLQTSMQSLPVSGDFMDTPVTEMDYESSDGFEDHFSTDMQTVQSSYGNPALDLSTETHVTSNQSVWSDFMSQSVNKDRLNSPLPALFSPDYRPPPPPKIELQAGPEVPPKKISYSPQPSPVLARGANRTSQLNNDFHSEYSQPIASQEVDPHEGLSNNEYVIPPMPKWPTRVPPPIALNHSESEPVRAMRSPPPLSYNRTSYSRQAPASPYRSSFHGTDPDSRRESEDTYSERVSTTHSSSRVSINGETPSMDTVSLSNSVAPSDTSTLVLKLDPAELKRLRKQRDVIAEIINTEAAYLKDMNVVEEIYKGTAEACPGLKEGDSDTLFRNIDGLVAFSTCFLSELKSASQHFYGAKLQKSRQSRADKLIEHDKFDSPDLLVNENLEQNARSTKIGHIFCQQFPQMQITYMTFLKAGSQANQRLSIIREEPSVMVWLGECDAVAKDLTTSWDLGSLLIKPVQRITRYPLLLSTLREATPEDHPDYKGLSNAITLAISLCEKVNDLEHEIGMMLNAKPQRKEREKEKKGKIDFRAKLRFNPKDKEMPLNGFIPKDKDDDLVDEINRRFQEDFLRMQVAMRDIEYSNRELPEIANRITTFFTSIEAIVLCKGGTKAYPELESKWIQLSATMNEWGEKNVANHVDNVKVRVIEPIEKAIKLYDGPQRATRTRHKKRLAHLTYLSYIRAGKEVKERDEKAEEEYRAITKHIKTELPKLSKKTIKMMQMCMHIFIDLVRKFFKDWEDLMKAVLEISEIPEGVADILDKFNRDFAFQKDKALEFGIVNGKLVTPSIHRSSVSGSKDDSLLTSRSRSRPPTLRARGESVTGDASPSLPTPAFLKEPSMPFFSQVETSSPVLPHFDTRDYPSPTASQSRPGTGTSGAADGRGFARPRLSTGQSFDSESYRRSEDTGYSTRAPLDFDDWWASQLNGDRSRPTSGLFNSAMPPEDAYPLETSQELSYNRRSSRSSTLSKSKGYNILFLAASLFEFNIDATKSEAGYPYLTYQAGEVFDVLAEKGELWLAKNQDDKTNMAGWIWTKHFARLAAD